MRNRITTLLAVALLLSCASCAFLRAAGTAMAGAGAGFAVAGPPGALLGAGIGAAGGEEWNGRKRLEEENADLKNVIATRGAERDAKIADLERRLNATPGVPDAKTPPLPGTKDTRTFWDRSPLSLLWEQILGTFQ